METLTLARPLTPSASGDTAAGTRLLAQFFSAQDPVESQRLLGTLLWDEAAPIIRNIVGYKINAGSTADHRCDAEDVCNDVVADLIGRLRDLKASGEREAIRDFRGYVAVAAYHGCNDYFRQKFPQRHRLQNKLRYLLTKDRRFALWQEPGGEWYCGRRQWRNQARVSELPEAYGPEQVSGLGQDRTRENAEQLARVFEECGAPLRFDDLVARLADIWGISEQGVSSDSEGREIPDTRSLPGAELEQRAWLAKLWDEIRELPVRQRLCLLLNLRDHQGGPAIALLPSTGVASIRQIAAALEMAPEELATLWKDLPLEDSTIAVRLGATRQQVINLRKSARERLARKVSR